MRVIFALIFVSVLSTAVLSSTLADYGRRLGEARSIVDEQAAMKTTSDLGRVTMLVPGQERIDLGATTIETNNTWLATAMVECADEKDAVRRTANLISISERLAAIEQSVRDLQTAQAGMSSKDEGKRKLAEILNRPEYQKPADPKESLVQKWIREFFEWLEKVFPEPNINPGEPSSLGSVKLGLQIVVFIAIAVVVGFLLFKFGPLMLSRFGYRKKAEPRPDRVILGERVSSDTSSQDLFSEAERLARLGDLRGAIRKGYIAALCELDDRRLVRLARHKTNRDYLKELGRHRSVYQPMRTLTGSFETSWYGLRHTEPDDWERFAALYHQTRTEAAAAK